MKPLRFRLKLNLFGFLPSSNRRLVTALKDLRLIAITVLSCSVVKKCCGHYQAWLSPLMTIDDNPDDYLEALTHEMVHDNLGRCPFGH